MAQKLAGLNTHGLCEWLTKKGITDFVSHIQAWNYDGQQLVALTEDQIVSLEISEANRKKLLKVIYPSSTAMSSSSGLLSRFRKKNGQSQSVDAGADNDEEFYDDDDEWDDGEFDDEEDDAAFDPNQSAALAAQPAYPSAGHAPAISSSSSIGSGSQSGQSGSVSSSSRAAFVSKGAYDQTAKGGFTRTSSAVLNRHTSASTSGAAELMQQEYYNPNMDRRSAEYLLQQAQVDGSFVVRNSSKVSGEFSLSLLFQGHIRHLRIRRRHDGMFALGELKAGEKYFVSVVEMVSYHKCEPINLQSGGYTILTYGYR